MGGKNPYIEAPKTELPQQKYRMTFQSPAGAGGKVPGLDPGKPFEVEVDPANLPTSGTGLHGSILDIALAMGVEIEHACGGVVACSTCHVVVKEGLSTCNESTDEEEDQLEKAPGLTPQSRLACQCVPNGRQNIVVTIPSWSRNQVREGK
jgi:2Fe-2S ferredoxin